MLLSLSGEVGHCGLRFPTSGKDFPRSRGLLSKLTPQDNVKAVIFLAEQKEMRMSSEGGRLKIEGWRGIVRCIE